MRQGLSWICIFFLATSLAYADITILDPKNTTLIRDSLESPITVSVRVTEEPEDCWYGYVNYEMPFNCTKGLNEFQISTGYFGDHYLEVYQETNDGKTYKDSSSFSVQPSEIYFEKKASEEPAPVAPNFDNILCFKKDTCLWTQDSFLEVIFIGIMLISFYVMYTSSKRD